MITERYTAVVTAIDEDEMVGGIRVACAGLLGDEDTELPTVVRPACDWGWFYIPDVGELVEIEVVASSEQDEIYGQASIDNPDVVWRNKRFYTDDDVDDNTALRKIHSDFTSEAYGKRRGFATPYGHIFMFDDTEGAPRIQLTHMTEPLEQGEVPEPEKYTRFEIEPDGSVKISLLNKHSLHFTTETGNLKIGLDGAPGSEKHTVEFDAATPKLEVSLAEGDHTMTLDGTKMEVKLGGGATLLAENKDANATFKVGDGAMHATIVEHLEALWGDLKTAMDAWDTHTHPTGVGPSGPAAPPSAIPAWDGGINSTKVSIPDG